MNQPQEIVSIAIGGTLYRGWESVSIEWSYKAAAMSFDITVSEAQWSKTDFVPFLDSEITISVGPQGNDLLLTGYIDGYEADTTTGKHDVTISGRSKGCDAVDSHAIHPTGRLDNKTLLAAATELSAQTGLTVKWTADVGLNVIPKVQLARGDTVFRAIEREARKQGLNLVAQPDGSIALTRPSGQRHRGQLVEGMFPFKAAKVKFDRSGQHSHIHVRGQRALGTGAANLRQETIASDPTVKRRRPKVVHHEGDGTPGDLRRRGNWEKMRQAGKGTTFSPTCAGWRDARGNLWRPGWLVAVTAPTWHIKGDLLLQSVSFSQSVEGTTSQLTLVDPRAHGGKAPAGSTADSWDASGDPSELE